MGGEKGWVRTTLPRYQAADAVTADRFDTLLEAGHAISTARSRAQALDAVREAVTALLPSERTVVVDLPLGDLGPEALDELGRTLVENAVEERSPSVYSDGGRSALCAPIYVRGEAVACLYADDAASELFGDDEQRLAAFLATLAGGALENAEGVAAVQDLTRSLEHQALHDALTGLPNRALFTDRVDHALDRAGRLRARVAVMLLDLDDFKTVNDSLGRTAGDQLLVSVAGRLRDTLREGDTAARLGGDEFAILIEDVGDAGAAATTAQRIIAALETPFELDGREVFVHPSVGIALGPPDQADGDADGLLRNADVAICIAKGRGRRRYEFFEPSMHTGVLERLALKRDLSGAFERGEFVPHYQPIVALDGGELVGLEALIRWNHPDRGLVEPAAFVPLAEETGLIRPIGHWMLREACAEAARWGDVRGDRAPLTVNVNLSPSQLQEPGLVGEVAAALEGSGLSPSQLVLEITETVLMQDTEVTIRRLRRLKDLGVRLAIDDFGTGYSSLGYLQRFPIDVIKVAKPFVDNLERGADESALVHAILRLADTLGLQTVAEGIERPGQLEQLLEMGCTLGQGFHFSRPLTAAAAESVVLALPVPENG